MGVVVDSSVLIELERRQDEDNLASLLDGLPDDAAITAIQVGELRVGVLAADTAERARSRERFLDGLMQRFPIIAFGTDEAESWASAYAVLRKTGNPVGERDLIIAATALANGHSVMPNNLREFERVPGLDVLPGPARDG